MKLDRALTGSIAAVLAALASTPALAKDRLVSGSIGLGVANGPSFPGSDETETTAVPLIDLKIGRYGFFNQRGLGLQNTSTLGRGRLSYGIGLGYDFEERIADDDSRLNGLPDVEAGASATLFMEYEAGHLAYGVEVQRGVSDNGHEGTRAKLYTTYSTPLGDRFRLSATPYIVWADDTWMEAFFSVTPGQAALSGLAPFEAGSGVAQGGLAVTGSYALNERIVVFSSLDIATLAGDAKDSSISFDDTHTSISAGVMFRF